MSSPARPRSRSSRWHPGAASHLCCRPSGIGRSVRGSNVPTETRGVGGGNEMSARFPSAITRSAGRGPARDERSLAPSARPDHLRITALSSVTAPMRASARPSKTAPCAIEMGVWARMIPWSTEVVPSVSELPTTRWMFPASAPPARMMCRPDVRVNLEAIWKMKTPPRFPYVLSVRSPEEIARRWSTRGPARGPFHSGFRRSGWRSCGFAPSHSGTPRSAPTAPRLRLCRRRSRAR